MIMHRQTEQKARAKGRISARGLNRLCTNDT
jgi:hypothetical protein